MSIVKLEALITAIIGVFVTLAMGYVSEGDIENLQVIALSTFMALALIIQGEKALAVKNANKAITEAANRYEWGDEALGVIALGEHYLKFKTPEQLKIGVKFLFDMLDDQFESKPDVTVENVVNVEPVAQG